jgi:dipeptidyl aminopeptidase/acylaminoacyl peptidase
MTAFRYLAGLTLVGAATAGAQGRFDLDAAGKIAQLADPQPSPDGRSVVIVVRRANYETNKYDGELRLIEVASGEGRNLVPSRKAAWSPRWSPTGDRLAFLAPGDSGAAAPQIWVLPMGAAGEAVRLTSVKRGVRQFAWKPDGTALAFVTDDEPATVEGPERHNKSFVVERNDYLAIAAPLPRHLWLIDSGGGEPKRLTSGPGSLVTLNEVPVAWTPDGSSIVIFRQAGPGSGHWFEATLATVEVASGRIRDLVPSFATAPVVSPDGRWVAYSAPRGKVPEFTSHGISVVPTAGGATRLVSGPDLTFWDPAWLDRSTLLLCGIDGTLPRLWAQPLEGRPRQLELGGLQPSCGDVVATAGGAIAMIAVTKDRPAELYWLDREGAAPRRLTDYNGWVSTLGIATADSVVWTTDQFLADGVLTSPAGVGPTEKRPLVLFIHGGPMGSSTTGFNVLPQLLATRGFRVFEPNYRGSTGRGNGYQSAVVGDAGAGPGRDVMAGVETLIKRGIVDTTRMGVSGWSYGGYMTTWLSAHYPRWKAAMAGAAVTDYADGYYLADYGPAFGAAWGGSPFKPPYDRIVREQSPITYAGRIKAPMLILATTGDARVPVVQSYKLYRALLDFGVPVKFVAYPVPGHFPSDPIHVRDVMRRWVGWFAEQLAGEPPIP